MGISARTAVCASLAFVLPQLALLERGGTPEGGAGDAALWLHNQPHPGTDGTRARLPNDGFDRLQATPFAPAAPVSLGLSWFSSDAAAIGSSEAGVSALAVLPRSRGPPARL